MFPDRLPKWLGLTAGSLMCGYILAVTAAEHIWGRPSSTAGLGFFVAPLAGLIVGFAAWLTGLGLRLVLRRAGVVPRPAPSWVTPTLGMAVLVGSSAFVLGGRSSVIAVEAARRPRVIIDSARLSAVHPPTIELQDRVSAPELQSGITNTLDAKPINWNGVAIRIENTDEHVVVSNLAGTRLALVDLHDFDYINGIHATEVCTQPDGRRALAVLVSLRATSHRAMLVVFGGDGTLMYQHHLERSGGTRDALYTGRLNGTEALAVSLGPVTTWTCVQ